MLYQRLPEPVSQWWQQAIQIRRGEDEMVGSGDQLEPLRAGQAVVDSPAVVQGENAVPLGV